jgi:predicted amidohydrolase YtcJ
MNLRRFKRALLYATLLFFTKPVSNLRSPSPIRVLNHGGHSTKNVLTFHLEPAFAIKEGLSEEVALRSITADPAEILGIALDVGMLRPGMRANLAVFNGEIFHYQTLCEMTFVDGQLVYDRNRSSLYSQIPSRK